MRRESARYHTRRWKIKRIDRTCVVVTVLCNQPDAFASDLGDDQSRYLWSPHWTDAVCVTGRPWTARDRRWARRARFAWSTRSKRWTRSWPSWREGWARITRSWWTWWCPGPQGWQRLIGQVTCILLLCLFHCKL